MTAVGALQEAGGKLRAAIGEIARSRSLGATWLQRIIAGQIKERAERRGAAYWDALFPGVPVEERARRRIRRTLLRSTAAGAAAATVASAGELATVLSEGVAAPLGLAAVALGIGAETLYTTVLQVDLAWDLASIYGVPLDPGDVGDLATLLGFTVGVDLDGARPESPPRQPVRATLRRMRADEFAHRIGLRLIESSVARNVVPVIGPIVSSVWNQLAVRRFAEAVHQHMRHRRAIVDACARLHLDRVPEAELLLEGAWLLATCDGAIDHGEALALSVLLDAVPAPLRAELKARPFSDDEEDWFDRLAAALPEVYAPLAEILAIVAGADHGIDTPERRFLRRVARVTGREIAVA